MGVAILFRYDRDIFLPVLRYGFKSFLLSVAAMKRVCKKCPEGGNKKLAYFDTEHDALRYKHYFELHRPKVPCPGFYYYCQKVRSFVYVEI
jgi:hypothetical protein